MSIIGRFMPPNATTTSAPRRTANIIGEMPKLVPLTIGPGPIRGRAPAAVVVIRDVECEQRIRGPLRWLFRGLGRRAARGKAPPRLGEHNHGCKTRAVGF